MSDVADSVRTNGFSAITRFVTARRDVLRGYASAISGSTGRLVFSLLYFVALANTLSIADFGLFATASAAGVMLSRILAFGFMSPLYRASSVKPQLIGVFTGGYLMMAVLSLPVLALASLAVYAAFFGSQISLAVFALIIASEALLWRPFEAVVIVNNGLGQFGRGALMTIAGTAFRAIAASVFSFLTTRDLATWAWFYLAANAITLIASAVLFYPRQRIRFVPKLYWRRMQDSLAVSGAEVLFYLQSEFDKLLVLALGGPTLAGIYAIVMRLVDLTAIPIRVFSMMLVQRLMRAPEILKALRVKAGIEAAIFAVSTAALVAMALVLHFFPNALGRNVSEAAPLIAFALLVPGLRNLVEYQAELLYARGQTIRRTVNLALLAAIKGAILAFLISRSNSPQELVVWLNPGFVALYIASAGLTYGALSKPAKSF
jgi:O-antigen/teichoic acid export membrane protein